MRTLRQAVVRVSLVGLRALNVLGTGAKHTQHGWWLGGKSLRLACLQGLPAWWPLRMSAPLVCMCVCQHATLSDKLMCQHATLGMLTLGDKLKCQHATLSTTSDAGTQQSVYTCPVVNVCTQPRMHTRIPCVKSCTHMHTRTAVPSGAHMHAAYID